jgi:hypothetical protein
MLDLTSDRFIGTTAGPARSTLHHEIKRPPCAAARLFALPTCYTKNAAICYLHAIFDSM